MSFIECYEKFLIKLLAPAVICRRGLGISHEEIKFCAGFPACWVFKDEPLNKRGYYKTVYMNNRRVKPWHIIPRSAFIEIRMKPKKSVVKFLGGLVSSAVKGIKKVVGIIAGVATFGLLGTSLGWFGSKKKGASNGTSAPTYSSNDNPDLTGAKNEILSGVVPVAFGRVLQVFNYGQFSYPLIRSGYGGNRYRVYSVSGYQNSRYKDFRLGNVLLSNYRTTSYSLSQANGQNRFIGWDNAIVENFNRELSFDQTQAVYQSATVYYNQPLAAGTKNISVTQVFSLQGVNYNNWSNKTIDIHATIVLNGADVELHKQVTLYKSDLVSTGGTNYTITKTTQMAVDSTASEYRYTVVEPNGSTRNNKNETSLFIQLTKETMTSGSETFEKDVNQGINSYNGDRNELVSQSRHNCRYCDLHFSFPQGLYNINNSGARVRVTIQAEVLWKRVGEVNWRGLDDTGITRIYTRDIEGRIQNLSSRITRSGNILTFRTPQDINDADDKFYEGVGFQFATAGQYQVKVMPIVFKKTNNWVGQIYLSEVIWRLDPSIPVVDESILPHVSQIACTFNATTQLDGEVDELGAIVEPRIKNLQTGIIEPSRNPVDIIYYLLTDVHSNPDPMTDDQIDMQSFLKARQWCVDHNCLCDGIITSDIKYLAAIDEIASNNQLYFVPNKWGKAMLKVDTNEDGRLIKTLFNADNSWDLSVARKRGKLNRTLAIRVSYVDEGTWSQQEITGYWYNGQCNWEPETGKDDTYYKPEVKTLEYIKNADNVKRRIAYELEIANVKNTTASFKIAREVLDLDVLDRVLVADYTRINDGVSGTINSVVTEGDYVVGLRTSMPFSVKEGMTITIRSVDLTGEGANVHTLNLKANEKETSYIMLEEPIHVSENIIRGAGFYPVEGTDFYYTGDLYMAGTAEILDMVISSIEEVSGEDFTSSVTCRLY